MTIQNTYIPDSVSHPGATLLDALEERGMTQAELAHRTGRPLKVINEIVKGKSAITIETAIQLEQALGISAQFWTARESQYREFLARKDAAERFIGYRSWANLFPIREMIRLEWIPRASGEAEQVGVLLKFFGVVSPDQLEAIWTTKQPAFRKSNAFSADKAALVAWLRKGELDAQQIITEPYDAKAFARGLDEARALTTEPLPDIFVPKLIDSCRKAGVAIVFVRSLPKTRASGATHWASPKKAIIQLSLRYRTNDHLWFTFFHEAAHILRHKKDMVIEDPNFDGNKEDESDADAFSANFMIPAYAWKMFVAKNVFRKDTVLAFAREQTIAPGIVVGRLQHEQHIPMHYFNDLKVRYTWNEN
ncbi:MAG: helix-turn-helix domain-containing protein [Elusimicrobiota bacterium]|nr:helix-turn-helix domain-containing protein [Elusimicrobiota bacterium]